MWSETKNLTKVLHTCRQSCPKSYGNRESFDFFTNQNLSAEIGNLDLDLYMLDDQIMKSYFIWIHWKVQYTIWKWSLLERDFYSREGLIWGNTVHMTNYSNSELDALIKKFEEQETYWHKTFYRIKFQGISRRVKFKNHVTDFFRSKTSQNDANFRIWCSSFDVKNENVKNNHM